MSAPIDVEAWRKELDKPVPAHQIEYRIGWTEAALLDALDEITTLRTERDGLREAATALVERVEDEQSRGPAYAQGRPGVMSERMLKAVDAMTAALARGGNRG